MFDINSLASKLEGVKDEEEEAEQKKIQFESMRKNHYKNEFAMAQALKNRKMESSDDEDK